MLQGDKTEPQLGFRGTPELSHHAQCALLTADDLSTQSALCLLLTAAVLNGARQKGVSKRGAAPQWQRMRCDTEHTRETNRFIKVLVK